MAMRYSATQGARAYLIGLPEGQKETKQSGPVSTYLGRRWVFDGVRMLLHCALMAIVDNELTYVATFVFDASRVFILPPGASIPLHDHPEMTVISQLLYGHVKVQACDALDPEEEEKVDKELKFELTEDQHLARMCTDDTLTAPFTCELLPDKGNVHEFVAGDDIGCAIFDILTPPYDVK